MNEKVLKRLVKIMKNGWDVEIATREEPDKNGNLRTVYYVCDFKAAFRIPKAEMWLDINKFNAKENNIVVKDMLEGKYTEILRLKGCHSTNLKKVDLCLFSNCDESKTIAIDAGILSLFNMEHLEFAENTEMAMVINSKGEIAGFIKPTMMTKVGV